MTQIIDYNPERWWWHMPHSYHISDRQMRGIKTHSLVRLLENQEAYVRAAIKHRWDNRKPGEKTGFYNRHQSSVQVLRKLRAEMRKRLATAPTPKHNHGKGTICPLLRSKEREDGRLSA